ncbi:hypothetical protein ABT336_13175 [Micromonospora sp. NPDC000207]|uniref:hypothetical protein n=1 Tax=Micromonospora sp. NPDC000207 TaxID=3154246 RepID=UPI0033223965
MTATPRLPPYAGVQRRYAVAFNALSKALGTVGRFVSLTERQYITTAVLNAVDADQPQPDVPNSRLETLTAELRAIHYPTGDPATEGTVWCRCDATWPCPTVTAVNQADPDHAQRRDLIAGMTRESLDLGTYDLTTEEQPSPAGCMHAICLPLAGDGCRLDQTDTPNTAVVLNRPWEWIRNDEVGGDAITADGRGPADGGLMVADMVRDGAVARHITELHNRWLASRRDTPPGPLCGSHSAEPAPPGIPASPNPAQGNSAGSAAPDAVREALTRAYTDHERLGTGAAFNAAADAAWTATLTHLHWQIRRRANEFQAAKAYQRTQERGRTGNERDSRHAAMHRAFARGIESAGEGIAAMLGVPEHEIEPVPDTATAD